MLKRFGLAIMVVMLGMPVSPMTNDSIFSNVVPQAEACRFRCGGGHGFARAHVRIGRPWGFPVARAVGRFAGRVAVGAFRLVRGAAIGAWRIATWPFRHYHGHGFYGGYAYGYGGYGYGHAFPHRTSVRVNVNVGGRYYF